MTLEMFAPEETDPTDQYKIGSYWDIKHVYLDGNGEVAQRYNSKGMIVDVRQRDNQDRIDWQKSTTMYSTVDEYREWTQLNMYTGRHYPGLTVVQLELIRKARPVYGAEIEIMHGIWQAFFDEYCWTEDDWHRMGGEAHDLDLPWAPTFSNREKQCPHGTGWHRTVDGTFCKKCHEKISDVAMGPMNERCMWWTYQGSMGQGDPVDHPDDCSFCTKENPPKGE